MSSDGRPPATGKIMDKTPQLPRREIQLGKSKTLENSSSNQHPGFGSFATKLERSLNISRRVDVALTKLPVSCYVNK